mmetsp:Transcript_12856/g.12759  ORF Transcript_12856/g.12759 Transcript_12856/m.12759 type:complete len:117 (+) Transcript_12856:229-579(+)
MPYFCLSFLCFGLLYSTSTQMDNYNSGNYECNSKFVNWFIIFVAFCPIAVIVINMVIRKLAHALYYENFLIVSKKTKVSYFGTSKPILIWILTSLDLFSVVWALAGLILGEKNSAK